MVATRPGDDPTPRAGEGGPRRTTAQLAADPAFTATYASKHSRQSVVPVQSGVILSRPGDGRLGDGSDGDGLFGSNTTISSDKAYRYVRVAPGVTVTVARGVRVTSWATTNNGTIKAEVNNGSNAAGATGGLGGGAPTLGSGSLQGIGAAGSNAGAAGGTGVGANGTASAAKTTLGGSGGSGGNGGTASAGATVGGTGGTVGAKTTPISTFRDTHAAWAAWLSTVQSTGIGGGSGAAGAGDGTNAGGGGGGGGSAGGFLFWVTGILGGSGVFTAPGGSGGNGAAGVAGNAGGGGAGGPGGGGITVVAALDTTNWTGTLTAPAGSQGSAGAGVGTGAAGTTGTAGTAGLALLLDLSSVSSAAYGDVKPVLALGADNGSPLTPSAVTLGQANLPVRFVGGPQLAKTYGGVTYRQNGLQNGNSGWNGPSGGGGCWVMEYVTDAPIHEVQFAVLNGKYRLKVDGQWVSPTTVLTYSTGNPKWVQVTWNNVRKLRHYEWYLNQAPVGGIAVGPTDTIYPPTTRRQDPTFILGDSFTEGATGQNQANTDHMESWAWQACRILGWDHPIVDGEGGTGYVNDSGNPDNLNGKKPYPNRITDDLVPLTGALKPARVIVAGGFNDGYTDAVVQAAATDTYNRIVAAVPQARIWVVYFVNNGSPSTALQTRRDVLKAAALANPNVVAFIDGVAGQWYPGPACTVPAPTTPSTPFMTGTGTDSSPSGTGNSDVYLNGVDSIHPNAAGHTYLAGRVAAMVAESLGN